MDAVQEYDLVILGAGPAGLTAGLYGSRSGLKTVVLDSKVPGGQMLLTEHILNYPGFPDGVSGQELAGLFRCQAEKYGCEIVDRAGPVEMAAPGESIRVTTKKAAYKGTVAVVATGCSPRRLGANGEKKFSGAGVSYCAVCDGNFFEDLDVVVVGGGDSALEEAAYLARLCRKVTIVHRRDEFRASEACQCLIRNSKNIDVIWDSVVADFEGDDLLESVRLKKVDGSKTWDLPVSGAFIYVGQIPNTDFLPKAVAKDDAGWIPTTGNLETSLPYVFAAGDVRQKTGRQVSTAVGDGALAAINAEKRLLMLRCEAPDLYLEPGASKG